VLVDNLTQVVYRQPLVIHTCYYTVINLLNLRFLIFLYCHQHEINFCLLMLFTSGCIRAISWLGSQTAWMHHYHMAQSLMPFSRQTRHGSTIGHLIAFLFGHEIFV